MTISYYWLSKLLFLFKVSLVLTQQVELIRFPEFAASAASLSDISIPGLSMWKNLDGIIGQNANSGYHTIGIESESNF
jgi:hypothetical protein